MKKKCITRFLLTLSLCGMFAIGSLSNAYAYEGTSDDGYFNYYIDYLCDPEAYGDVDEEYIKEVQEYMYGKIIRGYLDSEETERMLDAGFFTDHIEDFKTLGYIPEYYNPGPKNEYAISIEDNTAEQLKKEKEKSEKKDKDVVSSNDADETTGSGETTGYENPFKTDDTSETKDDKTKNEKDKKDGKDGKDGKATTDETASKDETSDETGDKTDNKTGDKTADSKDNVKDQKDNSDKTGGSKDGVDKDNKDTQKQGSEKDKENEKDGVSANTADDIDAIDGNTPFPSNGDDSGVATIDNIKKTAKNIENFNQDDIEKLTIVQMPYEDPDDENGYGIITKKDGDKENVWFSNEWINKSELPYGLEWASPEELEATEKTEELIRTATPIMIGIFAGAVVLVIIMLLLLKKSQLKQDKNKKISF